MRKRKILGALIFTTLMSIIIATIYLVNSLDKPIHKQQNTITANSVNEGFTHTSAVAFVNNMLKEAKKNIGDNPEQKVATLDENKDLDSLVTPELRTYIYNIDPYYTKNTKGERQAIQTLLSAGALLNNLQEKQDYSNYVYLDKQTGTAYVPFSLFLPQDRVSSFYFELVYVNNEWKFSPFSLIKSIQLVNETTLSLKQEKKQ